MSLKQNLFLKPRHKWFSCSDKNAEIGWFGPWDRIEKAILECVSNWESGDRIFIAQGRKLTKSETQEWAPDYEWEVETQNAFEVILPEHFNKPPPENEDKL